jgi:hypothetical protein
MAGRILILASVALAPATASGQPAPDVGTDTTRVRLDPITTLGADPDGPALSRLSSIAMDGDGFFYVASTYVPGEIAIFHESGAYHRSFGRLGQGPGEFSRRLVRVLTGPGDSVHVIDGIRHTVLAPRAESAVRLHQLPFRPLNLAISNKGRLVAGHPSPDSRELVHILSPGGTVERSFVRSPSYDPRFPYSGIRTLSNAGGGRFWVGHSTRYELELWSLEAGLLRRITRDPDWFQPWAGRSQDVGSRPRLTAHLAYDGVLWTIIRVPDPDHRAPVAGQPVEDVDMNQVEDTVIEAIDERCGKLIGSVRIDAAVAGFLGERPIVFTRREDEHGVVLIDVFRLSIER